MARDSGERRNKKKNKFKEKKKHPYKSGGRFRSSGIDEGKSKKKN